MFSLRSLIAALLLVSSSAQAYEGTRRVLYDPGGPIVPRMLLIEGFALRGVKVEVEGECNSACTLYAGLKDVCTYPEAKWGFHGPWIETGIPEDYFDLVSRLVAQYYPEDLRHWWMMIGRWTPPDKLIVLTGRDMHVLGVSYCADALP